MLALFFITTVAAQPVTNAAVLKRYLAESQLIAAMSMPATSRGTTSTNFSLTMVTRSISSRVHYVTGSNYLLQDCQSQKRLKTNCLTPFSFKFSHSSQVDQVNLGNTSKCEASLANNQTAESVVPNPMLGLSQYVRRPNWSTALCACERTQRRC